MRFLLALSTRDNVIPINYQYPLSAAIYKILSKADKDYTDFLHESGYGKGFKLFTFSDIKVPFKIKTDRLVLLSNDVQFEVAFHLPVAAENFVKGLFQSEQIDIADKNSRAVFTIKSIESLPSPLQQCKEKEMVHVQLKPLSPVVAGLRNEKGNYDFLSPDNSRFTENLIYNWRNKIATCYDDATANSALLLMEILPMKQPFKSRLLTIKANTPEQTKIRGWTNFGLKITAEKRFVELLLNGGCGLYNGQGMGCVEII